MLHVYAGNLALLADSAAELPHKPHILAALLACIATRNPDAAEETVRTIGMRLQNALSTGKWCEFRTTTRFLAVFSQTGFFHVASLLSIYEQMLSVLTNGQLGVVGDYFVSVIASTLPFAASVIAVHNGDAINNIINVISVYVNTRISSPQRSKALHILKPLHPDQAPFEQLDYLLLVWKQLEAFNASGWHFDLLSKLPLTFTNQPDGCAFAIAPIVMPSTFESLAVPSIAFRIFDDNLEQIVGTKQGFRPHVPPAFAPERLLITELVADVVSLIHINHKAGSTYLLELRSLFGPNVWAINNISNDNTSNGHTNGNEIDNSNQPGGHRYNYSQTLIEALLVQLLCLPTPVFRPILYHNVIMDLCRLEPAYMGPAFGKAIQVCFDRINYTDVECAIRLVSFFSHHLSNYGYTWNWAAWEYILDEDPVSKKAFFIRETVEKLIRLAYFDRVIETLPESFKSTLLADARPRLSFDYAAPSEAISEQLVSFSENITSLIRAKEPWEGVWQVCQETRNNMDLSPERLRDITIQTLLNCGSKTFSHTSNVMDRYLQIFITLSGTPADKVDLIHVVHKFWRFNKQFFAVTLDKLVLFRVVDGIDLLNWLFDRQDIVRIADHLYIYQMLQFVVKTALFRVNHFKNRLRMANTIDSEVSIDEVSVIEASLEAAERDKKQMYLTLFQKLVKAIGTFQNRYDDMWTNWLSGYLAAMLRSEMGNISAFITTLASTVFVPDAPQVALDLFESAQLLPV